MTFLQAVRAVMAHIVAKSFIAEGYLTLLGIMVVDCYPRMSSNEVCFDICFKG